MGQISDGCNCLTKEDHLKEVLIDVKSMIKHGEFDRVIEVIKKETD